MAYGSELYLGYVGIQALHNTMNSMGIALKIDDDIDFADEAQIDAINERLKQAHRDALTEIGLKIIDPSRINRSDGRKVDTGGRYIFVQGLDGKIREMVQWSLEIDYDPYEMGQTMDDVLVGVSLVSRYFPVFLDWKEDNGGSGDTISLTPDVLATIEVARKHIAKVLPFIADAPIVFREMHY
jgi:hypothetical protein